MKLKDARRKRGFTQEQLAARSGLSQSMIARIEGGDRSYSMGSLQKLAKALGLSPKSLIPDT